MTMEHKCYCRGDEITSLDLDKPEHLMPMMRPFSMRYFNNLNLITTFKARLFKRNPDLGLVISRIESLEVILKNMLNSGILTDHFYRGNGKLLIGLWKSTAKLTLDVHLLNPKYVPQCIVLDGSGIKPIPSLLHLDHRGIVDAQ
ncbi:Biotin biosynthesis protein BioC [Operophtera brumata]|uniref:Biotin biosynthesis protein BioC n=1 Tax=Operophtera brumata TaxID=104452 RepID=A0A0L7KNE9_OPEBR|nr:Biotin biosynthesis protein BioC [Operophtera brumata]